MLVPWTRTELEVEGGLPGGSPHGGGWLEGSPTRYLAGSKLRFTGRKGVALFRASAEWPLV